MSIVVLPAIEARQVVCLAHEDVRWVLRNCRPGLSPVVQQKLDAAELRLALVLSAIDANNVEAA